MLRSPHRTLELLDTPVTPLPHVLRPTRFSNTRLDLAIAQTHVGDLTPFAPTLIPRDLAVRIPRVGRVPASLDHVRPRTRVATHVPPLPTPQRFPVASLDLSRKDVALPYGIGRFIAAATLKTIAGGRRLDRLLKKTRAGWAFVPNDTRIDLHDNTQEFRLGALTIFS